MSSGRTRSHVLCRDCSNYKGRRAGLERRGAPRLCAAKVAVREDPFRCESFVPILVRRRLPRPERDSRI
jgi:hypothetical protein